MKKNTIMRIAAVVLMCTLVTACFASSTFAKYTSQATGDATVTVATWSILVGEDDIVTTDGSPASVDFGLFTTIKDTAGADEEDVAEAKIAPGTSGSFALDAIENASDVTADVAVKMVLAKADGASATSQIPPLQYKIGNGDWAEWTAGEEIEIVANDALAAGDSIDATTIEWMWDFNDEGVDNAYGMDPADIIVTLTIDANQVD